jgi:hypothetical protein
MAEYSQGRRVAIMVLAGIGVLCARPVSALGARARESELARLVAMLPGRYDNGTRGEGVAPPADAAAQAPVQLRVVRIYAPFLSRQVFYVHEAALEDERRVFSQRLWVLDIGPDKTLQQRSMSLREPQRWREGHLDPDLFKALMLQDVVPDDPGCVIRWRGTAAGFVGRSDPAACRRNAPQGGVPLRIEERRELTADELAVATLAFDDALRPVAPPVGDPLLHLRRR